MKSSIPIKLLTAHVLRFRIKLHTKILVFFTNHKKVNYTNESIFIKKKLNKNHELMKHLIRLSMIPGAINKR